MGDVGERTPGRRDEAAILAELRTVASHHRSLVLELEAGRRLRVATTCETPTYASYAASIVDGRRLLRRYIPADFFGDPAFDMMLDLFVATEQGERRSFERCVFVSNLPETVTSRYLDLMIDAGIVRRDDAVGTAPMLIALTSHACERVRDWLSVICSIPLNRDLAVDTFQS